MASISLPFLVSETNYRLACPVEDIQLYFDVRWNSRDLAWYLDIYESDDTPVAINVKVVLGTQLGNLSKHEFFSTHKMLAIDTSGEGRDAGFDDLGSRILVVIQHVSDLV
jgi:hypothetical protein